MRDAGAIAITAIRSSRFRWNSEKDLQDGIERVIKDKGLAYQREFILSKASIIDFMVGEAGAARCGIEVKIKGQRREVLAQLERYAERAEVLELVLVTGRLQLTSMPANLKGKPLTVIPLLGSLF